MMIENYFFKDSAEFKEYYTNLSPEVRRKKLGYDESHSNEFFDKFLKYEMRDWFYGKTTTKQRELLFGDNQEEETQLLSFFIFTYLYRITFLDYPSALIPPESRPFFKTRSLREHINCIPDANNLNINYRSCLRNKSFKKAINEIYPKSISRPKTNRHALPLFTAYTALVSYIFSEWGDTDFQTILDSSNTTYYDFTTLYNCYLPILKNLDEYNESAQSDKLKNEIQTLFLKYLMEALAFPELIYKIATFLASADDANIATKPQTSLSEEKIFCLLLYSLPRFSSDDIERLRKLGLFPTFNYFDLNWLPNILLSHQFLSNILPDCTIDQESYNNFFNPQMYDKLLTKKFLCNNLLDSAFCYMTDCLKEVPEEKLIASIHFFLTKHYNVNKIFCFNKEWSNSSLKYARQLLPIIQKRFHYKCYYKCMKIAITN